MSGMSALSQKSAKSNKSDVDRLSEDIQKPVVSKGFVRPSVGNRSTSGLFSDRSLPAPVSDGSPSPSQARSKSAEAKNTIGAINPKDGALVWRQHLASQPGQKGHLRSGNEQDTVISAVGNRVTAWSASDGRLVWETSVEGAAVEDLEILEQEDGMTISAAKDAIVLTTDGSSSVKRLDGKTGRAKWTFEDTR